MSDAEVKQQLENLFKLIDIRKAFKKVLCHGFDSWEDYEKYGDAFTKLKDEKVNS